MSRHTFMPKPLWCIAALAMLLAAAPSHALYKVIGPDGRVTYTDRPPNASEGKATPMGSRDAPVSNDIALPLDLRQAVTRFPVTLYVAFGACDLCDTGRQFLRQRGIPFNERQAQSADDADALERLTGGRDLPTLTIGSQVLRGLSAEVWGSYLDSAGYPRQSRLPANYVYPAVAPITARRAAPIADEPAAPAPAPAAAPASPGPIRF
jgi:hypothetical protein